MTTETSQFVSAECVHLTDLASNRTATIRTQSEGHVRPVTETWERGVNTPPRPIRSIGIACYPYAPHRARRLLGLTG